MQLAELAHIVQAELKSALDSQIEFSGVAIDTRRLHAGNLYIAYAGPKHNGHDFISEAARLGASAALVSSQRKRNTPPEKKKTAKPKASPLKPVMAKSRRTAHAARDIHRILWRWSFDDAGCFKGAFSR